MADVNSILVASDFSADAGYAMERTAMLCSSGGIGRVTALHVIESSWKDSLRHLAHLPAGFDASMEAGALKSLAELSDAIRRRSGVSIEPRVVTGNVADAILDMSADYGMLVLGARGGHILRDLAVGTTTARIIRLARKPVLVVRSQVTEAYRRALVAVDFSSHSRNAFDYANSLAPDAALYLTHIYQGLFEGRMKYSGVAQNVIREYRMKAFREAAAEMNRFIEESGEIHKGRLHRVIEHGGHIPSKLVEIARKTGSDLIVAGRQGKSLVEHLLLGSVTLHLLAESPCDVLVTQ